MQLVFVHLGQLIPEHLKLNIERHLNLFPEIPVTLVHNCENVDAKFNALSVETFKYTRTPLINEVVNQLSHDKAFRNNFWIYTLERFFALEQFHLFIGMNNMMHIESDVLLLPDFPWDTFATQDKVYFTRFNADKDVASILFSPSPEKTKNFVKEISYELRNCTDLTDMTALSILSNKLDDSFFILPSAPNDTETFFNGNNRSSSTSKKSVSKNYDIFNGIFDPAPIGMWLTGQDPRNQFGFSLIMSRNIIDSGDSYIDPSQGRYLLTKSGALRVIIDHMEYPLWNLHIHSKNLDLFGKDWISSLSYFVENSTVKKKYSKFSFIVLKNLLLDNFNQGTLLRFLGNLPLLNQIKLIIKKFLEISGLR